MLHRFAGFELDTASLTLRASGRRVDVPRKAVETLALLAGREGAVVSKAELMDALWPDGFVEEANLTQHIYLLRRAFREHGVADPIETHARRGYRFNAPPAASRPDTFAWRRWGKAAAAAAAMAFALVSATAIPSTGLNPGAMRAYELGRYFWNLRSVGGMTRSIPYFEQVISLEPHRGLGYAALADAYTELADFEQPCAQCRLWQQRAEQNAARALALEPACAEAHVASAMVARVFRNDDRAAAREFRAALALDPQNALAHQWYGNMLVARGSLREGVAQLQLAAAQQPISTATYAWLARAYYYERRYADAEHNARLALALEPTRLETTVLLGLIEEERGKFRMALRQFDAAGRLGVPADSQALRAGVYGAMGKRATALHMLRRISPNAAGDPYVSRDMVLGYALAGDVRDARLHLSRVRYETRLSRQLFVLDPHVRAL